MRDFTEHSLTDEVVRRLETTTDPRLKGIMQSLTRHLHDWVREIEPSAPTSS